jgi:50S ribosomal protein L16 3-hydroxylase
LRAPATADLLLALCERLGITEQGGGRYRDPDLQVTQYAGEIDRPAIRRLRRLLAGVIEDRVGFDRFAGSFLTRYRLARDPEPHDDPIGPRRLLAAAAGKHLVRNPWTRLAWIETQDGIVLFAAGDAYPCSAALARCLCASHEPEPFSIGLDERDQQTLVALVNGGHLLLLDD